MKSIHKMFTVYIFLIQSFYATAGEFGVYKDDFTGETANNYQSTQQESISQGMTWVIRMYNKADRTVWIGISPQGGGATSCDKNYVLFKDSSGEIHKANFEEKNLKICVGRVPVSWVFPELYIRLPLFEGTKDGKFDNSDFDPERLIEDSN